MHYKKSLAINENSNCNKKNKSNRITKKNKSEIYICVKLESIIAAVRISAYNFK